jgi:UDP-N-acetylglucosamine 2-epimerase (non-hydrolysing)
MSQSNLIRGSILVVIGTRPEAIKLAPLVLRLQKEFHSGQSPRPCIVCSTGQHREMTQDVFETFGIRPDVDLDLMRSNQTLCGIAGSVLTSFERVLVEYDPEWVVVQGDTITAAMAGFGAFLHGRKVAHVEAGLRTGDRNQPFPEETNRRMISLVADVNFAPTWRSYNNLMHEHVDRKSVYVTGNTGIDAVHHVAAEVSAERAKEGRDLRKGVAHILVTAHRRENHGQGILDICTAIKHLYREFDGALSVCWPVHPNPKVKDIAYRELSGLPGINLSAPFNYRQMVRAMLECDLVLTDSGGLQEEAPALGKPVLVLRNTTERPEALKAGVVRLVGTVPGHIVTEVKNTVAMLASGERTYRAINPYGDGHASQRIADFFAGRLVTQFYDLPPGSAHTKV